MSCVETTSYCPTARLSLCNLVAAAKAFLDFHEIQFMCSGQEFHETRSMLPAWRPATSWVHYATSCNTLSTAPEDGQNNCPRTCWVDWNYY